MFSTLFTFAALAFAAFAAPTTRSSLDLPSHGQLHPNGKTNLCLAVNGAFTSGTPVVINDCDGSASQDWQFTTGKGPIKVYNSNTSSQFCLDVGSDIANSASLKISECYEGLTQQTFNYKTEDPNQPIQVEGQSQCLDVKDGKFNAGTQVQTWACVSGSANQKWVQ